MSSDPSIKQDIDKKGSWKTSIDKKGAYVRKPSPYRSTVSADKNAEFPAESGRYHLYVSYACPWAHRTLITRKLKGLESAISVSVVDWFLGEGGWRFKADVDGATEDHVLGSSFISEVYRTHNPDHSLHFTVPVLFDKKTNKIVNNESAEIIRMFNTEFNEFCETDQQRELHLYPEDLREKIDSLNEWIYPMINNGVYKSGFAQSQEAYEEAVEALFDALERVDKILGESRYIAGDKFTEADTRLITTLLRFDPVYVAHFKCNIKRIVDFPNIWDYVKHLYQDFPAIRETTNFDHIKKHYFGSHKSINPFGIVPVGPKINWDEPHSRK